MAAGDPPTPTAPRRQRRDQRELAMVETAGADVRPEQDPSAPPMAVSIAGVSTACSKDALVSSAKAVRKTLAPE